MWFLKPTMLHLWGSISAQKWRQPNALIYIWRTFSCYYWLCDEPILNGYSIESLQDSSRQIIRSFWPSSKHATAQDLARADRRTPWKTFRRSALWTVNVNSAKLDTAVRTEKAQRLLQCTSKMLGYQFLHLWYLRYAEHYTIYNHSRNKERGSPKLGKPFFRMWKPHNFCQICRVLSSLLWIPPLRTHIPVSLRATMKHHHHSLALQESSSSTKYLSLPGEVLAWGPVVELN